jgi:hypothetical protein
MGGKMTLIENDEEDMPRDPVLVRKEHEIFAVMKLSGEQVEVGILKGNCEDTPYFKTSDNPGADLHELS